jgi:hypothetical protein
MPNPNWMKGDFVMNYNILFGAVSGTKNFEFEFGEKCALVGGNSLDSVDVILFTDPIQDQQVPNYIDPSITFAGPVGKTIRYIAPSGQELKYQIVLDSVSLVNRNNYRMPFARVWQEDSAKLVLKLSQFMPGNDTMTLKVTAHIDSLGVNVRTQTKYIKFLTDPAPDFIPVGNIAGAYPFDGQYNFYRDEVTDKKGYMKLEKAMPSLLYTDTDKLLAIRFRQATGKCITIMPKLTGNGYAAEEITYPYPTDFFESNGVYEMQVLQYSKLDPNWNNNYVTGQAPCHCAGCTVPTTPIVPLPPGAAILSAYTASDPGEGTPQVAPPTVPTNPFEKSLYTAYFRVSEFKTFREKMSVLSSIPKPPSQPDGPETVTALTHFIDKKWTGEPFDYFEVSSLLKITDDFTNSGRSYRTGYNSILFKSVANVLDNPPVQFYPSGFNLSNWLQPRISKQQFGLQTVNMIVTSSFSSALGGHLRAMYSDAYKKALIKVGDDDYDDYIKNCTQINTVNHNYDKESLRVLLKCPSDVGNLSGPYDYPLKFNYTLPGRNVISSSIRLIIKG